MGLFLYITAGSIPILIDCKAILEIISFDNGNSLAERSKYKWQGRTLEITDLGQWLDQPTLSENSNEAIVYRATKSAAPYVLLIGKTIGLIKVSDSEFIQCHGLPEKTERLFDSLYIDPQNQRPVYRLRFPLLQENEKQPAIAPLSDS